MHHPLGRAAAPSSPIEAQVGVHLHSHGHDLHVVVHVGLVLGVARRGQHLGEMSRQLGGSSTTLT